MSTSYDRYGHLVVYALPTTAELENTVITADYIMLVRNVVDCNIRESISKKRVDKDQPYSKTHFVRDNAKSVAFMAELTAIANKARSGNVVSHEAITDVLNRAIEYINSATE